MFAARFPSLSLRGSIAVFAGLVLVVLVAAFAQPSTNAAAASKAPSAPSGLAVTVAPHLLGWEYTLNNSVRLAFSHPEMLAAKQVTVKFTILRKAGGGYIGVLEKGRVRTLYPMGKPVFPAGFAYKTIPWTDGARHYAAGGVSRGRVGFDPFSGNASAVKVTIAKMAQNSYGNALHAVVKINGVKYSRWWSFYRPLRNAPCCASWETWVYSVGGTSLSASVSRTNLDLAA